MVFKSVFVLIVITSNVISGSLLNYTIHDSVGGWLKMHVIPATRDDAWAICDFDDAVLASPVNIRVRDGIKNYISQVNGYVSEIMTGVRADLSSGDFVSSEGVHLSKMPIILSEGAPVSYGGSESCIAWKNKEDKVRKVRCSDTFPFVCYKKRKSLVVSRCGNPDLGYTYEGRTDSCYKFHRSGLIWIQAYKECKKEGGYLAVINSMTENEVLTELFSQNPTYLYQPPSITNHFYAFIGIRDFQTGESWQTVKGQSLAEAGFSRWAPGEPNNISSEHCGSLYREGNLNDLACDRPHAFICEKNAEHLTNDSD